MVLLLIFVIRYYLEYLFIKILSSIFYLPEKITPQSTKHKAKSLVLSCMDYRFIDDTIKYLNKQRLGDFDYFVLAGASLGYNESKENSTDWYSVFEDHVKLAIDLHSITEIIVVDHMDCGYYHAVYGDQVNTPEKEERKHNFNLHKFVRLMKDNEQFKHLDYKLMLAHMNNKGKIRMEEIDF